jgi:CHAT domain-containing protein
LHAVKLDATRSDLRTQIVALRKSFDSGVPPRKPGDLGGFDIAAASGLYLSLISAIQPAIQGASTVYIGTSGMVSSVPFDVLVMEPATDLVSAKWWIASTLPVRIPNASALVLARSHPATHGNQPLAAFADPSFSGAQALTDTQGASTAAVSSAFPVDDRLTTLSFDYHRVTPLPDTLTEARAIAASLGASDQSVVSGAQATRSAVLRANLADDRVVLFATHGIVPGQVPGWPKSGLAMTYEGRGLPDSILTADDIVTLRLNADWAVLSACNTGLATGNAGDSISELSRAFFAAGARSVLVTQWSVESRSATEITTQLFKNYAADPSLSKAKALAKVERDMLGGTDGPLYRHPYFWGAYVLAGDGAR